MTEHTVYQLARLADCADPESIDSPGANWLRHVENAANEAIAYGIDDDTPQDVADSLVPTYTDLWRTFVDVGAYNEDLDELGGSRGDMTIDAQLALYMIAERLVSALLEEASTAPSDDEGGNGAEAAESDEGEQ